MFDALLTIYTDSAQNRNLDDFFFRPGATNLQICRNMAREAAIELLVYTIYVIILSVLDNAESTCINIITNVYEYVYKHRFNYS